MKIAVFGDWHLALVYSACLSRIGNKVTLIVENEESVNKISNGQIPIQEPGLIEQILKSLDLGTLTITSCPKSIEDISILWVCADTKLDQSGKPDPDSIENDLETLFNSLTKVEYIFISSQVPIGFTEKIQRKYEDNGMYKVKFAYLPENLQLGSAIESFISPARTVIGAQDPKVAEAAIEALTGIDGEIVTTDIKSAEMLKHALNAYLALNVVFANEWGQIAQMFGASSKEVVKLLKLDPRIGRKAYVSPAGPIGGGTLIRDVKYLSDRTFQEKSIIKLIEESNNNFIFWICSKIIEEARNRLTNKVSIVGITYKEHTNTLRGSWVVNAINILQENGIEILVSEKNLISDPMPNGVSIARETKELLNFSPIILISRTDSVICEEIKILLSQPYLKYQDFFVFDLSGGNSNIDPAENIKLQVFGEQL